MKLAYIVVIRSSHSYRANFTYFDNVISYKLKRCLITVVRP